MIKLRDYQLDCLAYLDDFKRERLCVGSPTGSGKTVLFSYFAASQLVQNKKTLILVHRKELLEQTRKIFINQFDYNPTLIMAGQKTIYQPDQSIYLGMVETVFRREKLLIELRENIDNLIVDECHLANFFKLIEGFKRVIGFTATPQIVKKNDCLQNYYKELYEVISINQLIEENHLVSPTTYAPKDLVQKAKRMSLGVSMGDFKESDQEREINKIYSDVIDSIDKFKQGRTLIFHPSIALSKKVSQTLNNLGYESYHLDGETSNNEREFIKQRLKDGSETIVNNCGVLTTGFDEPRIETIVLNRLTKSENLFIQMVGRGSRTAPEINKDKFILLDLYGNSLRLKLWEAYRDWQAKFSSIKESKDGEAPVKVCPQCEAVVPAPTKVCPHCGYDFESEEKEANLKKQNELVLLRESTIREKAQSVMELIKERGHKPFSALYKIVDFVFNTRENKTETEIEKELMVGLEAWCHENKGDPKIRFNHWYKNKIIEIYKEKI